MTLTRDEAGSVDPPLPAATLVLLSAAEPAERAGIVQRLIAEHPGHVDLRGAMLEQADLHGVDLAGARLQGARLGGANLAGAMLEEADLSGAALRFVNMREAVLEGAGLRGADLWGATLDRADLTRADLQGASLVEGMLREADLAGASLRDAVLSKADLQTASLQRADLRGATLAGADLRGAVLRDAHLEGVDLSACEIGHVQLSGVWLDKTRLEREQLGGAVGEELVREYDAARKAYLALERNFRDLGDPEASRWAYRKRRRMQKLGARTRAAAALGTRRWHDALNAAALYATDQVAEWLCDYGESIPRVFAALITVYVIYAVLYGITGSVVHAATIPGGPPGSPTRDPVDLAIFSLLALSTSGSPAVGLLPRSELVHFLTGTEALLGIFLTGLLGFVAGNRIRR